MTDLLFILLAAILGGILRRLWGSDNASKAGIGLGWLRQSYVKAAVVALSAVLALAGPWPLWTAAAIAAAHVAPWWLPWWGESNMAPPTHGGRWAPWQGAAVRLVWFGSCGAVISWLAWSPWAFVAGLAVPAVAWAAWRWVPARRLAPLVAGPTDVAELVIGAVWFGALAALLSVP